MKKIILALAATTFLAGAAFADDASGTVSAFDAQKRVITLDTGMTYTVPEDVALPPDLAVGQMVTINMDSDNKNVEGVLISPAKM